MLYEAGLAAGVFNVVTGLSREAGAALAGHPEVDKVAFTGSTATGVSVAKAAVANVNRITLDLGAVRRRPCGGDRGDGLRPAVADGRHRRPVARHT